MPILLQEGSRPEPIKFSAEEARALPFKTPLDLAGAVVRWELVDSRTGVSVALEQATNAQASAAGSTFDVELDPTDTSVAGRYQLRLTYQPGGEGPSLALPGGRVRLVVTGATRTLDQSYFEQKVGEVEQTLQQVQEVKAEIEALIGEGGEWFESAHTEWFGYAPGGEPPPDVNNPPVANQSDVALEMAAETTYTFAASAYGTDADGDALTWTQVTQPQGGAAQADVDVVDGGATLRATLPAGPIQYPIEFTARLTDGEAQSGVISFEGTEPQGSVLDLPVLDGDAPGSLAGLSDTPLQPALTGGDLDVELTIADLSADTLFYVWYVDANNYGRYRIQASTGKVLFDERVNGSDVSPAPVASGNGEAELTRYRIRIRPQAGGDATLALDEWDGAAWQPVGNGTTAFAGTDWGLYPGRTPTTVSRIVLTQV